MKHILLGISQFILHRNLIGYTIIDYRISDTGTNGFYLKLNNNAT